METNGSQHQGLKGKSNDNESKAGAVNLDEDLRRKVEMLQIGDRNENMENSDPSADVGKSYEDWKDELPIHLKSLKFMIDVLNDKKTPGADVSGRALMQELKIPPRETRNPIQFPNPTRFPVGRRPRMGTRDCPRRRTKSADPDLSSYRNETPFGTRSYKHRNSEGGAAAWFCKRRSVELNGVYVVEEISEEDEDLENMKRVTSADGSPDSLSLDMEDANLTANESLSSPLKPLHRIRRDLWNISPISEDFSESSDKEFESLAASDKDKEDTKDSGDCTISSTNATFGDSMSISISSRISCTSPILSHSPSFRKTPTYAAGGAKPAVDTPPTGNRRNENKKMQNFARVLALEDISDRDEEAEQIGDLTPPTESDSSDEEKTESFEIDLASIGNEASGDAMNTSFTRDKSNVSLKDILDKTEESVKKPETSATAGEESGKSSDGKTGDGGNPV